ncbi:MAG TPA: MFS transporter [Phycisphaerae bacterium]|jgi:ACS family hexuronate transporter-like MFS transporter
MIRWRIAILISIAIAISYLDRGAFPAAYKAISVDFNFSKTQKAFMDSGFLVAYGLMYIGGGKLLDLLGTRRGFTLIMLFWSLACASHGFAIGFWSLLVSRFLLGFGEGGGFPAATRAVAEWFTVRERSTAMGIMNGGSAVGGIVAPLLILNLILPNVAWFGIASWRWVFFITGFFGILWLLWWLLDYRKPEEHPRITPGELQHIGTEKTAPSTPLPKVPLLDLLTFPQTWGLMLAKFLTDAAWYFYIFWLPTYLMEVWKLDYKATGSINWIPPAASGIGCLCGGMLSSYLLKRGLSPNASRKIALGVSAAMMPLVMLVPFVTLPWVITIFSIAYFGQQSWSTLIMIVPTDMYPRRALGTIAGLVGFGGAMGGVSLGQLAGYLLDHGYSYIPIMIIAGSLHVIGFAVILLFVPHIKVLTIPSESTLQTEKVPA